MGITVLQCALDDLVKERVLKHVKNNQAFTSLQISNEIKTDGYHIRHRDVSGLVRDAFNYYVDTNYDYDRTLIDVVATEWNEDTNTDEQINTEAYLYHPLNYDPEDYNLRTLVALSSAGQQDDKNFSSDIIDKKNDDEDKHNNNIKLPASTELLDIDANVYEFNEVYSYKVKIRAKGLILINSSQLAKRSLVDKNFNLIVNSKQIKLNVIQENNIVSKTSRGELSIWKVLLEMAELVNDDIWVHMTESNIVIDNKHPLQKHFESEYNNRIISFTAQTPTSKRASLQSVVLKFQGVRKTQQGNYLCTGLNFKLVDGEIELEDAGRSYRLDRIYKDSIKLLF